MASIPCMLALTLVESLLIMRKGWRAMLQDIVCGLLSAHQELNETMQKYRESTLHRCGPMGGKKVGDGQILPNSFSMLWTPLRYSLSLQIFWGKKSHMLSKHTCHMTCRVSHRPLGGSHDQHSEASYCILVPHSMPHFLFPSLSLPWDGTF